ncbi:hypothetical protein [Paenibacillus sp. FSL R7-0179]|uniref:hypothetical protein n=1 Tax=Paenibacillus sp. FSL R7-0179 TaxID=2921672 RepID=UPI0030FD0E4C
MEQFTPRFQGDVDLEKTSDGAIIRKVTSDYFELNVNKVGAKTLEQINGKNTLSKIIDNLYKNQKEQDFELLKNKTIDFIYEIWKRRFFLEDEGIEIFNKLKHSSGAYTVDPFGINTGNILDDVMFKGQLSSFYYPDFLKENLKNFVQLIVSNGFIVQKTDLDGEISELIFMEKTKDLNTYYVSGWFSKSDLIVIKADASLKDAIQKHISLFYNINCDSQQIKLLFYADDTKEKIFTSNGWVKVGIFEKEFHDQSCVLFSIIT